MKTRRLIFDDLAWEDYLYWQTQDKKNLRKVNQLIKDVQRSPFTGLGKPEPLKYELAGTWSRRINDEHRLVYEVTDDTTHIINCRYHYK